MIVLDTHAWVWFVDDPKRLSEPARNATEKDLAAGSIVISSISSWEVAMLAAGGRLKLTIEVRDWIAKCEALPFFNFVPVDDSIFMRSVFLPGPLHTDPADRIIIATALRMDIPIVTKDQRIRIPQCPDHLVGRTPVARESRPSLRFRVCLSGIGKKGENQACHRLLGIEAGL